ncbi:hypothetical protein ALDI51_05200 [Alicycliphilus denitrificans]|jgi:uncharacterized membrane-anchored protein YjiN (DUF445 family)|uniref:DUF445 domain-containing protein n=1 Tax=Alicycliphilus denitrificans TaxID=179636 RepID=UPI000959FD91|nr:DUF445 domain-containing protein [Alicycliphilus denitrificans]MBN9572615.1 DUF445 domain-containing protein [Alicycliphilus denitrificans]OJW82429.1 MAG: hypothetical protein BGO66_01125 [Alicycliphilus sp. 69-12]BCN37201.1 hypothetical protein ALDI51_05200 [Alicycliphilus denitrificans]HRO81668.1 DUF445 domain-containing protein [Alicycliphilus denitrificans]
MHSFPGLHEYADHAGPRRLALALLVLFAAIFAACTLAPRSLWVDGLKAVAEAAMVGALADWFAVAALFRRIPLPLVGRHTDIVARNKDRIGGNLALFVRDRFLDAPSLVAMIRRHDPADMLAQWLTAPANAGLLGRQVSRLALMALDTVEDEKIQAFLAQAARALLGRLDLSRSMASALAALTHQGRHQELLDALLERLGGMVRTEEARAFVADTLVQWIRREHPLKQKVLPTDWLSGKGAAAITHAVDTLLKAVADDPRHELREALDGALARLAERLQNDPDWARRGEELRAWLQNDEALGRYVRDLWAGLRRSLREDLAREDSELSRRVAEMGQWLGMSLAGDAALRVRLNVRLELWAATFAPDVAQSVAEHIRTTVQRWDAQEMARLVEQHIGRDLQYIRINGTLVGGLIGLVLFTISHAGALWALLDGG